MDRDGINKENKVRDRNLAFLQMDVDNMIHDILEGLSEENVSKSVILNRVKILHARIYSFIEDVKNGRG